METRFLRSHRFRGLNSCGHARSRTTPHAVPRSASAKGAEVVAGVSPARGRDVATEKNNAKATGVARPFCSPFFSSFFLGRPRSAGSCCWKLRRRERRFVQIFEEETLVKLGRFQSPIWTVDGVCEKAYVDLSRLVRALSLQSSQRPTPVHFALSLSKFKSAF